MHEQAYAKGYALQAQAQQQYVGAATDCARPRTGLEAIGNRLAAAMQNSGVLANRLEDFEIRLVGNGNTPPSAQKTPPCPLFRTGKSQ